MIEYSNLVIYTREHIYEPAEDSFLAARFIERVIGSFKERSIDVVDIGTGTGFLGLVAASAENVRHVVFADIDKNAVALAKHNYETNKAGLRAECEFTHSDLFSNIKKHFDLIVFNAPYLRHEQNREGETARQWDGGKEGIEISIRFLEQAKAHLNENGRMVLVASSLSNQHALEKKIKELELKIVDQDKDHAFFEDILVMLIEP